MVYRSADVDKAGFIIELVIFLCAGLACLAGGGLVAYFTADFVHTAEKTHGVVAKAGNHSNVRYNLADGGSVLFGAGYLSPDVKVGDRVGVLYRPDDPYNASVDAFGSKWGGALIILAFGAMFTVIGGGGLIAKWVYKD